MTHQTKSQYFVQMVTFLMGRYGLDKPVEVVRDNRLDCPCCVDDWNDTVKIKVKYNTKFLNKFPHCYVLDFILHEVGHLINALPYTTDEEKIKSEHCAEKFALKIMKKEYKEEYKDLLEIFKNNNTLVNLFKDKNIRNPYYWANKTIYEYRISSSEEDLLWLRKEEKKLKKKMML